MQNTHSYKKSLSSWSILFVFLICSSCSAIDPLDPNEHPIYIDFVDVGQGSATLIRTPLGTTLIDAGPNNGALLHHLQSHSITRLHAVIITHKDLDHYGGLFDILPHISIDKIYTPFDTQQKYHWDSLTTLIDSIPKESLLRGDTVPELSPLSSSILWPLDKVQSGNHASTVIYLSHSTQSLLITGDLDEQGEAVIIEKHPQLRPTILVAGHHGSKTASSLSFIAQLNPQYSIISVGEHNPYGHPHPSTVSHLNLYTQNQLFRTDQDSTIHALLWPHWTEIYDTK